MIYSIQPNGEWENLHRLKSDLFYNFIPMDKTCDLEQLYERKFPKNELPLKKCRECLFNVLCLDYSTYEESND